MAKFFRDGAILHSAIRIGKNGKPLVITKFRSMKRNAHAQHEQVFSDGHFIEKLWKEDARITRVGKFLRKTNLDELPQIMNFLKGELSLVGIRPLTRRDYRILPPDIKKIYDEVGPALAGIQYACKSSPPKSEEVYEEYRKFYALWKKNRAKTNLKYVWKIVANRIRARGWSQ